MRKDIVIGSVFPDYELPDQTGKHRTLSEIQGNDPLIVVLSRGSYCPKDQQQMRRLTDLEQELAVGYAKLVTISTDNLAVTNEFRAGVNAHWPFLSDPGRKVQKDLDIAEYTDPKHDAMVPHTVVLEAGLVVFKIYVGYWYFGRPTLEDLRHDLREIFRKRFDWDLAAPEVRAAWERGEKERFYPYGKSYAQVFREQG